VGGSPRSRGDQAEGLFLVEAASRQWAHQWSGNTNERIQESQQIGVRHPVKGQNMQHVMQELKVNKAQIWFIAPIDSATQLTEQSVGYKCEESKPNVRRSVAYVPQD
jgi:hypothetical protein